MGLRTRTKYLFGISFVIVGAVVLIETLILGSSCLKIQHSFPATSVGRGWCTRTENRVHQHQADAIKDPAHIMLKNAMLPSFSSGQYHKIYPVNCTAVFAGDAPTINSTNDLLSRMRDAEGRIPVPSDDDVLRWSQNCSIFKDKRGYPWRPFSKEEADFPIAYSMVVYQNSAQVERLLRVIYQPQNVYCIHIDKTSPAAFQQAIRKLVGCFANVFVASKLENVEWGRVEAVLADLHCMEDLLNHSIQWKYVLNLCGMDFPLKTNLEIVRQLKAYNDHNCIEGYIAPIKGIAAEKIRFAFVETPVPHNITVYKGDTYIAATRDFVDFIVNQKVAKDYLKWLENVLIPDEYFTSSLNRLPYAPGGNVKPSMECNVRFRKWVHGRKFGNRPKCTGKVVRDLCIFSTGYLQYFYRTPQLFVNKFQYDFDPIPMQCMEELLNYRTIYSSEFDQWENFPVTNFFWQND